MAYTDLTNVNYTAPATTPASTATTQQYQDQINQQLSRLSQPTDPNSAAIRAQTDPYAVATQRGLRQNQAAIAEANYAGGNTNTGANAEMQQQARENASTAIANNTANVMATAEAQRQQEQEDLLGLGAGTSVQQQQVTNQADQFGNQLGLNYAQLGEEHNAGAAGINYENAALAQNNAQFQTTSNLNQQSINNALAIAKMQNDLGYYSTDVSNNGANYRAALGASA